MNINKFFLEAKKAGIEASELRIYKTSSTSISIFKGEIENNSLSSETSIVAKGIYNDKLGMVSTEKTSNNSINYIINSIKDSALYSEKEEAPIIYHGDDKYSKSRVYSKALDEWKTDDIIKTLFEIESKLKKADKKVSDVQVEFAKSIEEKHLANSYGLNLKNKTNYFYIYASVIMKKGEEIKDGGDLFLEKDPTKFNIDEFVNKIISEANEKFNGNNIKTGTYSCVLNQDSVASLVNALISNCDAESIQKHSSKFEGQLNKKLFSSKLTILEKPLEKNCFYTNFDDEGVATQNKKVIEKGIIKSFFYNLVTAAKDNVKSTGNASGINGIGFTNLYVKPGRLSEENLFEKVKDGVYITSISGLHCGLDAKSGDFSLQSEGFLIKDGEKDSPLTLFTVSGNLFKMFNHIIGIANNSKLLTNSTNAPSIAFRSLKISN